MKLDSCFFLLRVLQGWPHSVLDMDVLHILHGEMGTTSGWYAFLCAPQVVLRQCRQHRREEGEMNLLILIEWGVEVKTEKMAPRISHLIVRELHACPSFFEHFNV